MTQAPTPTLPDSILDDILADKDQTKRIRRYMCVFIVLSSTNYPDVIPQVYAHFNQHILSPVPHEQRFRDMQIVREGLIKSTGIAGAARTGNAMRALSQCIPESLRESSSPRSAESWEQAQKRGMDFWSRIYARNPDFDPDASVRASPDYAFVIREVLYARVFSFDGIIDDLTTGYAIVAALYGMDCPNQLQHHMKGMLWNGATRHDLEELQHWYLQVIDALGVQSRHGRAPIPSLPTGSQ